MALGGLAFLYSATQQTDPTRRITEEVIGGGQFVAGVGYILAAVPKPPVPPAIVISPLRTATAQIFGGAARIFGAAGITYSIASALADLTELTQIANIQRDAMTDSERAAADERSRQESEFYKTLRSPARH